MNDTTKAVEITADPAPITRMQALTAWWIIARARVSSWWVGRSSWPAAFGVQSSQWRGIVSGLLLAALVLFFLVRVWSWGLTLVKPEPVHAPVVATESECIELDDLDDQTTSEASPAPVATYRAPAPRQARPTAPPITTPMPAPQPAPQSRQASTWGETELDRAIAEFSRHLDQQEPTK